MSTVLQSTWLNTDYSSTSEIENKLVTGMDGTNGIKKTNKKKTLKKQQHKKTAVVVLKYLFQILHMQCLFCLLMTAELLIMFD